MGSQCDFCDSPLHQAAAETRESGQLNSIIGLARSRLRQLMFSYSVHSSTSRYLSNNTCSTVRARSSSPSTDVVAGTVDSAVG